jgi:hypothetical protein
LDAYVFLGTDEDLVNLGFTLADDEEVRAFLNINEQYIFVYKDNQVLTLNKNLLKPFIDKKIIIERKLSKPLIKE